MAVNASGSGLRALEPPEVTVVIPTRDRERHVLSAVAAALAQQGVELEVVVVDDGSRDDTAVALGELRDGRLLVLRNDASEGVAAARNRGLAQARGRWVAFLDDDDLWSPWTLRMQVDAAGGRDAAFAYCDSVVLDERLDVIGGITPPSPEEIGTALQSWNFIGGPSAVVADADLLRRLGGFDERLSVLADWDLWIRLADAGPAAHCPTMLVGYVIHAGGMFTRHPEAAAADFRYLAAKHRDRAARLGIEPDMSRILVALAYGHARARRRGRAAITAMRAAARARTPRYAALGVGLLGGHDFVLAARRRLSRNRLPAEPEWLAARHQRSLPAAPGAADPVATLAALNGRPGSTAGLGSE